MLHKIPLTIAFLLFTITHAQNIQVSGSVFEDINDNGILDLGETRLPGVTVTDQQEVVRTDKEGRYSLQSSGQFPYVSVSLPSGYTGKFYYPAETEVNFPLISTSTQQKFRFIHASDTHMDSLNLPRMERFREMADSLAVDFVIITGDLVRDALRVKEETASAYYRLYLQEIAKFRMPVYSSVGNHELFGIERDKSLVSPDHPLYGKAIIIPSITVGYILFR